ncbi:Pol polyprotein [Dictyocoela muelleri]|nr:Pol polyprotein [Dictyocoela muelleri]
MEVKKGKYIIVGIDYFCRFAFAKRLKLKTASKVLRFLKEIFIEFKFEKINVDNGRGFGNKMLKAWSREKNVEVEYSIPYYHQSNGRVERLNRTIRDSLKKLKGNIRSKLKMVIKNYNMNMIHRGTGFTLEKALLSENMESVLDNSRKYEKEFKFKNLSKFNLNDEVLIRNEIKKSKMDNEFYKRGIVVKKIRNNTYKILFRDGKELIRHSSQLKP